MRDLLAGKTAAQRPKEDSPLESEGVREDWVFASYGVSSAHPALRPSTSIGDETIYYTIIDRTLQGHKVTGIFCYRS